ncbi:MULTISPECIES: SRPBCC family protein [Streptomyces]|uniref:MxaD family protein n=1 Tax=Streptomyces canarius TaxID=285453 RepID=A0ABQ3CHT0_9ACTN|nr:SRPBCC family protein [Streptomyces canarius]GHA16448.1 MxaD family protein [Streptomyces canarius]
MAAATVSLDVPVPADRVWQLMGGFDSLHRPGPFPVAGYRSTLTVREAPGGHGTRVEWSGTFIPVEVTDQEAVGLFHGIYADGLAALSRPPGTPHRARRGRR